MSIRQIMTDAFHKLIKEGSDEARPRAIDHTVLPPTGTWIPPANIQKKVKEDVLWQVSIDK